MNGVEIIRSDNLEWLQTQPSGFADLIVIDVPFNTGVHQVRESTHGTEYVGYDDSFDDFMGFMRPRMVEAKRILTPHGSLFFWADCREIHYCKVMLDGIFGRASFKNEIIWAYDYGARTKTRWSAKHDNILWYAKDADRYTFNYEAIDRIPYLSPERQSAERAALGKTPTDVWWHTIVPTSGSEKIGYATQKPLAILERIVTVHSNEGDTVVDFFAGSGTTGIAAVKHGRNAVLVDVSEAAVCVMRKRFSRDNEELQGELEL